MRQQIVRLVCDNCGLIAQWEISNSEPLIANVNVQKTIEECGWHTTPKDGCRFATNDLCEKCHTAKWGKK